MKNVAVSPEARQQGIGKLLLHAATGYAMSQWSVDVLYTHVSPDNEAR